MTIFYIDAKSTALKLCGTVAAIAYLIVMLLEAMPILIVGISVDATKRLTKYEPVRVEMFLDRWFRSLERRADRFFNWLTKITTTEKDKMWRELRRVEKDD